MNDNDFPVRMAGSQLGLDIREGLKGGSLDELRRAVRTDKFIPPSLFRDFYKVNSKRPCPEIMPENSCGIYDGTQPSVTFGL